MKDNTFIKNPYAEIICPTCRNRNVRIVKILDDYEKNHARYVMRPINIFCGKCGYNWTEIPVRVSYKWYDTPSFIDSVKLLELAGKSGNIVNIEIPLSPNEEKGEHRPDIWCIKVTLKNGDVIVIEGADWVEYRRKERIGSV